MTSIFASLCLLTSGAAGKMPDSAARLLTIGRANCERLVRLINDILDIQKLESGQGAFKLERVSVRPLIESAIDATRGFAREYGISLRLDAAAENAETRADSDRLIQVVTNLLSNAIKFSATDTEVVVGIERRDDTVHVWVRDHGQGIPDEFKPRIFEKFAQADATDSRAKSGTGLGLSIVRQIVEQLGGQVGFHDAAGGGTVFYFNLPYWNSDAIPESKIATLFRSGRIVASADEME
jgi:signal transduction histidine kinase